MRTNTICPHERGDSYNIISIEASCLYWILSKIRFNFEDDYSVDVQLVEQKMVKVLYTFLYLLSKVGLKVPIKPKLSTYGTLLCAYPAE